MGSTWERLLLLATPLLAAVSTRRKTTAKKSAKSPTASRVQRRPARPSGQHKAAPKAAPRPKGKMPPKRAGPAKTARRGALPRGKAAEPAHPASPPPPKPLPVEPRPVAPTGRAILLAPARGQYADSVYPKFRWLSVGGATRYQVAWSEDANFTTGHMVTSIATEATVPVEKPLRANVTYYWRVRGGNDAGWGPWSPAASFRVLEEPPAP